MAHKTYNAKKLDDFSVKRKRAIAERDGLKKYPKEWQSARDAFFRPAYSCGGFHLKGE